jgi:rare lipoprotein A
MESTSLKPTGLSTAFRRRFPFYTVCLSTILLTACVSESTLDTAPPAAAVSAKANVPASLASHQPVPQPAPAPTGSKFETPDQYGGFPATRPATGPLNVLAQNPYLNEVNAQVTQVPLVANESSSAVYPPQTGDVSHYSYSYPKTLASGMAYQDDSMTAAHKELPFGTIVRCTRLDTGQSVVVLINDRGPYVRGRVLDLNDAAARKIGLHRAGVAPCKIEILAYPLIETTGPRGNG